MSPKNGENGENGDFFIHFYPLFYPFLSTSPKNGENGDCLQNDIASLQK